ncbi:hypothetical protein Sme01_36240 [Sphaerisporangium melleum]|uniref:Uncharacterized protein n=1 Tax=Sphaerisporangium melleum TaxID=321316 RepID=A0A917RQW5_9ACTN|nr:hypothetical protein [Sphaerisporangium melleum]GGL19123.1 hypothetical protein GCM10007964_71420 [Sphaerisporangium melleum]GII71148.1 hypothetical protein Sme01_36240 [Sphaerisporangium melleum]
MIRGLAPAPHPAIRAAYRLRAALEPHGIAADVNEGAGLALVSVWHDLVVWCGPCYLWWAGGVSPVTGRFTYRYTSADAPETAARRVAERYHQLRRMRSPDAPSPVTGAPL